MTKILFLPLYLLLPVLVQVRPPEFIGGMLKDPNGQPISNTTQKFVRASVSNSFPDFVQSLKSDLDNNFPDSIVNIIWVEPETPSNPIYPTDFVTGIPKEWTIENPALPTSPQMNIDVPDASLPDLSGLTVYGRGWVLVVAYGLDHGYIRYS